MSTKELAQIIVDWVFDHDCTRQAAVVEVRKILKEALYGNDRAERHNLA